MSEHPKVFISYSHQNAEYENKILEFANHLRSKGIDANIDLYEEAPAEGWPRWMENQINKSDFVLVVNSKSYYEKCYSESKEGKGISWEVNIVYQHIYDASTINTKFIPIFFEKEEEQYILTPLKSYTYYNVRKKEEFEKLYWRLRGISKTQKPPLGNLRPLPEKEKKTMFFSSPIDLDKWNAAKWRGVLYLFSYECVPVLGLLYQDYAVAKTIFTAWKRNAKASGLQSEELLIASVSRYQWMDELNGSKNRDLFQHLTGDDSGYLLMPIGIKDKRRPFEESNLIIDLDYAIQMKKVQFKIGREIDDNDLCKVVLNKAENV